MGKRVNKVTAANVSTVEEIHYVNVQTLQQQRRLLQTEAEEHMLDPESYRDAKNLTSPDFELLTVAAKQSIESTI